MSEKYRMVLTYRDDSERVFDKISLNAALTLQDGFWSIDNDEIHSISIERAEE